MCVRYTTVLIGPSGRAWHYYFGVVGGFELALLMSDAPGEGSEPGRGSSLLRLCSLGEVEENGEDMAPCSHTTSPLIQRSWAVSQWICIFPHLELPTLI